MSRNAAAQQSSMKKHHAVGQKNLEYMEELHRRLKRNLIGENITPQLIRRKFLQQTLGNPQCYYTTSQTKEKKKKKDDEDEDDDEDEEEDVLVQRDMWATEAMENLKAEALRKNITARKLSHGGGWWSASGKWKVVESVRTQRLREERLRKREAAELKKKQEELWKQSEEEKLRAEFNSSVASGKANPMEKSGGIAFSVSNVDFNSGGGKTAGSDSDSEQEDSKMKMRSQAMDVKKQIIATMAELLALELGSLTGYGLYGDGKKHPAAVGVTDLELLTDFTRIEPVLLNSLVGDLRPFLSRWKYVSMSSRQLKSVQEYENRWSKLEQLHPLNDLNWLADQFVMLHLSREYPELGLGLVKSAMNTSTSEQSAGAAAATENAGSAGGNSSGGAAADGSPTGGVEHQAQEDGQGQAGHVRFGGEQVVEIEGASSSTNTGGNGGAQNNQQAGGQQGAAAGSASSAAAAKKKDKKEEQEEDAFQPGQFGWISITELQAVCGAFLEFRFPNRDLYIEDNQLTPAMYLKALEIAFSQTSPIQQAQTPLEVNFDTACVVCEICRILWLRFQKQGGWQKNVVSQLMEIFPTNISGEPLEVPNSRVFNIMQRGGIPVDPGDEQSGFIDLLRESDINQDGVTSFEEFCYLLKRFDDTLRAQTFLKIVEHGYEDFLPGYFKDEWLYALKSLKNSADASVQLSTKPSEEVYTVADLRDAFAAMGLEQQISRERLRQMDRLRDELEIDPRHMDEYDVNYWMGACFQQNCGDFAAIVREWSFDRDKKRMGKYVRDKKDLMKPTCKLSILDHIDDLLGQDFKTDWWSLVGTKTLRLSSWQHDKPHFLNSKLAGRVMSVANRTPAPKEMTNTTQDALAQARKIRTLKSRDRMGIDAHGERIVAETDADRKPKEIWRIS
ncbi:unnamed protein product [Amoebophrya sp. A120]|nr:unnamed protein product [Amoebophrya sp. A120]|eukprot:GSA120T00010651001.1